MSAQIPCALILMRRNCVWRRRRKMARRPARFWPCAIDEGATHSAAAKIGGVGLQIIRDRVLRLNARGPDGLLDGKSPGHSPHIMYCFDPRFCRVGALMKVGSSVHAKITQRTFDFIGA